MFISWEQMKSLVKDNKIITNPIKDKKYVSSSGAGIDLHLGEEVYITTEQNPRYIEKNEIINIDPGQFAALVTEEILDIPTEYLGFITIRFSYKSKGLVNISGFHVDPGYKGKLVFTVYNIGPRTISLQQGKPMFSLFLAEIKEGAKYKGIYANMEGIPLDIVQSLSGAQGPSLYKLNQKIESLDLIVKIFGSILMTIVGILLGKLFNIF